jgi:hypothetical protein
VTEVSEEVIASIVIALMMEAVSTSETSLSFYETAQLNIPEDRHLKLLNSTITIHFKTLKLFLQLTLYPVFTMTMRFGVLHATTFYTTGAQLPAVVITDFHKRSSPSDVGCSTES